ncbi:MAG TPA: hypothetical protein VNZ22_09095 [Bacillota bacterium]|nr:hypothetical protein [Bacillota bacterium]
MKQTFFTLTSARAGTLYLRSLFQQNIQDCVCRHEPFFDWGNPTLFGRAIYDAYAGRLDRVRALLAKKRAYIERLPGRVYLESSHAFLKSAYVAALEFFPELRLIHLIRDPLKVARSEAYRETWRRRVHAPFHFYKGEDQQRHFVWALTGQEAIFQPFAGTGISLFQWYLIQWIEIENRAMQFLEQHQLQGRCFTLHSPGDLNDPAKIQELFDFFGLARKYPGLVLSGRKNRSLGYSRTLDPELEREYEAVVAQLPARHLDIFQREPYAHYPWSARLRQRPDTLKPLKR